MTAQPDFDALYVDADPFGYRTRWYEERKRQLLMAMLPARRYVRAWEWGCSNGELTAALAARCDAVLATDIAARAIAHARARLAGVDHVELRVMAHPQQWPDGAFDLIVFSEVGYYLPAPDFERTLLAFAAIPPTTTLVACHWRPDFMQAERDGDAVHAALASVLGPPALHCHDDDMQLDVWPGEARSIARREGLR